MSTHTDLIRRMSIDLGMLPGQLESIIKTAPLRYKKFSIPKRDGSLREIAQPAREVKAIQRWIVTELRKYLPIHAAATAYEKCSSIVHNAEAHKGRRFILKMDLRNFFPSIGYKDLELHLTTYCRDKYNSHELKQILFSCLWARNRIPSLTLCIGAPSSPFLSNSIMYDFDLAMSAQASSDGVTYTRYADDLTFSVNRENVLMSYPNHVERFIAQVGCPSFEINTRKTVHASRAGKQVVTGLILTPDGRLSVGRDRKRLARAMFHRAEQGQLSDQEVLHLRGLLSFIDSVEPKFSDRLRKRYLSNE